MTNKKKKRVSAVRQISLTNADTGFGIGNIATLINQLNYANFL
jgi:hypothetical protein